MKTHPPAISPRQAAMSIRGLRKAFGGHNELPQK